MTGHIQFRHHPNAQLGRVAHDVADVVFTEVAAVAAELRQLRKGAAAEAEGLIVAEVQMQHVQFDERHRVERAQNRRHGNEVPRDIDHQAAPNESRRIGDRYARHRFRPIALSCAERRKRRAVRPIRSRP